jgi:hypothetical protein
VTDEGEFWQLIKTLGRRADVDDFDRLVAHLARRPEADITGFADLLAAALWELDTPAHYAAAETASDDVFLSIRCAVVAAGRQKYIRVLRKPSALRKFADDEAELLLTVAEQAYEQATGSLWEHQTPVSYETRSNTVAWGDDAAAHFAAPTRWLQLVCGAGTQAGTPRAYMMLLHAAADAVAADPAWQQWWEPAEVPACELSLLLESADLARPEASVKKGRKRVQVHLTRDPGRFPADDPEAVFTRATDDLRDLLDLARERLGLSPLPPFPALSSPVDLPAALFRPDPGPLSMLPAELREALMHGDLLQAQEAIGQLQRHQATGTPEI